jgi:DNA-binding MarR family transcriptional regulator
LMSNYIDSMDNTAGIIALISSIRDKANRLIQQQLKGRGINDIVPAHGGIFVALFRNSEMTMGELARFIDRDKSTVTTLVEKLTGLGYIERRKDDRDNRVSLIRLTDKGKALEAGFLEISRNLLARTYEGFTGNEKMLLIEMLIRINNNL